MSEVMVPIRSVKQFILDFGVNGIGKGLSKELVREQIMDAFQKEIFGQLTMKFGDPELLAKDISDVDPETKRKVDNILSNSVRKWKRLCMEFSKYRDTYDLIMPGDLMLTLEDIAASQTNDAHLLEDESNG